MSQSLALNSPQPVRQRRRATDSGDAQLWRALYYFNLYRLILAGAFLTLAWSGAQIAEYGVRSTVLFQLGATLFAMVSVANLFTITRGRPGFIAQASLQIILDIILITVMMHASNGVSSGLGLLMVVSVAGAGVVLSARATMFFAALASICILGETTLSMLLGQTARYTYLQIGLLGAGVFMTGFIVSILASRLREKELAIIAARRDLQRQQLINDQIVQNLDSGIIVINERDEVVLFNNESQRLLNLSKNASHTSLTRINQQLESMIHQWRDSNGTASLSSFTIVGTQIQPRVSPLQEKETGTLVVYLDDQLKLDEQAQQHKLASLGRLSAAIAHEIRNPLSALSHASQLLAENESVSPSDKRLLDIIEQHTDRINDIIESVLQLGRRESPTMQWFDLRPWILERVSRVCQHHDVSEDTFVINGADIRVFANQGQMTQILDNLLNNAVIHGTADEYAIVLMTLERNNKGQATLMVWDKGPGISDEDATHLFEPFFTTDSRGTGLGLYISRELCAANGARLDYIADRQPGCCFAITFYDEPAIGV